MEERELVILLLSLSVMVLALRSRDTEPVPGFGLLCASAGAWLVGYVFTVAETALTFSVDIPEHGAYLTSCALLVGWVWRHWGREPAA